MPSNPEFENVFEALKKVLRKHERIFKVHKDDEHEYILVTKSGNHKGAPMWFAAVRCGKAYVSYHLMAVQPVSPELKKRMQGKTCFNFKKIDPALFEELKTLTAAGVEIYRKQGWL